MHILHVIGNYPPFVGGAEIQAQRLTQFLSRNVDKVEVLTRRGPGQPSRDQTDGRLIRRIPYVHVPKFKRVSFGLNIYRTIVQQYRKCDIIHAHIGSYVAFAAAKAANALGKPIIVKMSSCGMKGPFDLDLLAMGFPFHWGEAMARYLVRHVTAFIGQNEQTICDLRRWHVPQHKIHIIPNGIVLPKLSWQSQNKEYRRKLGLRADAFLLISVGNFTQMKNHARLLTALNQITKKCSNVELVLLGEGQEGPKLKKLAQTCGIENKVFFGGCVSNVSDYLLASDVFILPSLHEGMSNALLEAMALGIPCVVSDIPGNRCLVENEKTGLLFHPTDTWQLIKCIKGIQQDRNLSIRLGQNARKYIRKKCSMDQISQRYCQLYSELLKKK